MKQKFKVKNFDSFVLSNQINEGLTDSTQSICNQVFINSGLITYEDGTSVEPRDIVKAVDDAIAYLADEFSRTIDFANRLNIIYLRSSKKIKTMAVDEHMNLYMNAGFIFHVLQMKTEYIAAVIMHEVFHVLYDHIQRGKNWVAAQGLSMSNALHRDNNLAADVEVNQTLVRLGIIDANALTNVIHGIYLKNKYGGNSVTPMEDILGNEEYMKLLREMCPPEVDPSKSGTNIIKTTKEWDKGFKDAWNKLSELIKKYGYKKVWQKLQENDIINGVGELNTSKDINDIMGMNFIQIKSFDEYITEKFSLDDMENGQTYNDGFTRGLMKVIGKLANAMNGGGGGGKSKGGDKYDSDMDLDELDDLDIPEMSNDEEFGNDNDDDDDDANDPDKGGDGSKQSNKSSKSKGSGSGKGKSDDKITDDDLNKLAKDLKNKMNKHGSSSNGSNGNDESIGGTGSYVDSNKITDSVLKDSGYDQEAINRINKIRETNKIRNTETAIKKAKDDLRRNLTSSEAKIINGYLDAIEVSSEKYKNVWKEIMKDFLHNKTRRAGTKIDDDSINWKRKSRIALGIVGPQYLKVDQDPQDVNVYVDVSQSMKLDLLEVICKSLVIFSKQYKYSGINICPWATTSNGIHRVDDFDKRNEELVTDEILKIVSKSTAQCGGGTESSAVLSAMVDVVVNTLANPKKKKKDDVHVVITDGYFDYYGIEKTLRDAVKSGTDRDDVANKTPENTFWMIYDADDGLKEKWTKEITEGKVIFITSDVVIKNK